MFSTKAYTLSRLISEVSSLNSNKIKNTSDLANFLSPRLGKDSTKFQVMNAFLNNSLSKIASSPSYGKTVKQRVLAALKARKRYGSDFSA